MTKKRVVLWIKKTHGTLEELADQLTETFQKLSPEDQKEWSEQVSKKPSRTLESEWIH